MSKPAFRLFTCEGGEIVIRFADDVDESVKRPLLERGYQVVNSDEDTLCCPDCGKDIPVPPLKPGVDNDSPEDS